MSEKLLEEYDDVFADIVNVLLFNGKRLIKPEQHYEMDFSDIKNGGYSMSGIFERVINMGISEGMEKEKIC